MAAKKQTPPPIDRPLSKAYLREFAGWSDQFPPGQSEPNSLRVMENVMVDRNGAVVVRPGLRHLTYTQSPDISPVEDGAPGIAYTRTPLGSLEPFYLNDGTRARLFAVREPDGRVGFRALLIMGSTSTVATLPECGFTNYDPDSTPFSEGTEFVHYVQIDNTILALSDNGEPARHFHAGVAKSVSVPQEITAPTWEVADKPRVVHPDAAWINVTESSTRRNLAIDPVFKTGEGCWKPDGRTAISVSGDEMEIRSLPARTNLINSPLHDPASDIGGWHPEGGGSLVASGQCLMVLPGTSEWVFAKSSRMVAGIEERERYMLSLVIEESSMLSGIAVVEFSSLSGAPIGVPYKLPLDVVGGRWSSPPLLAPEGSVTAVVRIGGRTGDDGFIRFREVMFCREAEREFNTFFHGGMGGDHSWTGEANRSPSVYHPPVDASVTSLRMPVAPTTPVTFKADLSGTGQAELSIITFSGSDAQLGTTPGLHAISGAWAAYSTTDAELQQTEMFVRARVTAKGLERGRTVKFRRPLVEQAAAPGSYFNGSSSPTSTVAYRWEGQPHLSASIRIQYSAAKPALTAEAPAATTLISSDAAKNTYKMGICYTFENEVGESSPSQITEVRMMRGWSQWLWKKPATDGQPTGADTTDPNQCADQLVIEVPRAVYDRAVQQGARRWIAYAMSWSDQDPVPVTVEKIAVRELYPDPLDTTTGAMSWESGGWQNITPRRTISLDWMELPDRFSPNFSYPLRHKFGVSAADRLIMVGDPTDPSTISWSSNEPGKFTIFSSSSGGGQKTLSSGNLQLPHSVALWQNPQSTDTLTILCASDTERSITYYMQPFTSNAQQGTTEGMGFEETTNTPGSESPYAVEVLNNALYRPTDTALLKSTASNYNINHKVMTENISRAWSELRSKYRMVSAQLDNRLYYIVHNPKGDPLREDCIGNEIWVLDIAAEQGHWSRFLIQASALRTMDIGGTTYMGVVRPEGISYLDPEHRWDDEPGLDGKVRSRPIPWRLETNLQGANRAHDAWAHLQQMTVTLGSYTGRAVWGLRGYTLHGEWLDLSKTTVADAPEDKDFQWSQTDQLLVRRDLMEWYFYAQSAPGEHGWGGVQLVQYRYTPTTVNVGYEHGSVETFEYGSPPAPGYARDGVVQPFADARRSWE